MPTGREKVGLFVRFSCLVRHEYRFCSRTQTWDEPTGKKRCEQASRNLCGKKERNGRWPGPRSGAVVGVPGEKWANIEQALRFGGRGLPPGLGLCLSKLFDGRKAPDPDFGS